MTLPEPLLSVDAERLTLDVTPTSDGRFVVTVTRRTLFGDSEIAEEQLPPATQEDLAYAVFHSLMPWVSAMLSQRCTPV